VPEQDRTEPESKGPVRGGATGDEAGCSVPRVAGRPATARDVFSVNRGHGREGASRPQSARALGADEEMALLRTESRLLRSVLEAMEDRLAKLEAK